MKSFLLPALWMSAVLTASIPAFAQKASYQAEKGRISLFALQQKGANNLVFTFPRETAVSTEKEGTSHSFVFDVSADPADLKLRQVLAAFPESLRNASLSRTQPDGTLKLTIDLPDGYDAAQTVSGRRVTVSIFKSGKAADKDSEKKKEVVKSPVKEKQPTKPVAERKTEKEVAPVLSAPVVAEKTAVVLPAEEKAVAVSTPRSVSVVEPAAVSEPLAEKPVSGGQDISVSELTAPSQNVSSSDSVYYAASLSFPWRLPTAAAAFRRGGYVWIVFNGKGDFNFDMEREIYKDIIYEIIQIPHSQATIFRMVTAAGYNPSMRREGLLWIVDLMYSPVRPKKDIALFLQRKSPYGPRISVPLKEKTTVLSLIDPEIGDLFHIVPLFAVGEGLSHRRDFVDASFLPTAQGLVITPNVEDLDARAFSTGVEIRGGGKGLRFSAGEMPVKTDSDVDPMTQTLEIGQWGAALTGENYYKGLAVRTADVAASPADEKNKARLKLARYYLANGQYPESLGVLRVIEKDNPGFAALKPVVALRGAANFMMKRYPEAVADFLNRITGDDENVRFWRAAAQTALAAKPSNFLRDLRENIGVLRAYPQEIRARLAITALRAAIDGGDDYTVQNLLETAANSKNPPSVVAALDYYYALWLEMNGNYAMALSEMRKVAEGTDLYYRAMGGLEKIRLAKRNRKPPHDQIADFEHLAYAWRGDDFEQKLMRMLAEAYREEKDFENLLRTLREMQIRFAGLPEAKKIPDVMRQVLEQLYLKESFLSDSPIKAIAMYNDFHEYLPPGEKGAQIARRLADELVSMDLLDQAASLLETKMQDPVGETERGILTTRLALVRLLNREPQKALDALDSAENLPYSKAVLSQRRHIRAKALADLKRTSEAADLLDEDDTEESRQLLAEIFWQAQDWGKAADVMKTLIKKPDPKKTLTDDEAQRILNWAAALRLAGRPKVVIRLRENFLPYMKKTPLADAFDFITRTTQAGIMDYRQIEQEIEAAKSFTSFAKKYTSILKEKGLSQTVQ